MKVITAMSNWYRSPSTTTSAGYACRSGLIGQEYTDAYSLGLARVDPGGRTPTGVGVGNQAIFVIDGKGIASLAAEDSEVCRGSIIKIPGGVPHELRNTGAVPMWLLTIHDPPLEPEASAAGVNERPESTWQRSGEACRKAPEVVATESLAWKVFEAEGVKGYELKPMILGDELTNAYSVDLMRVAGGGFSAAHTDHGRHAFAILEGQGCMVIDGQTFDFQQGDIVKVPQGSLHELRNHGGAPLVFLAIYDPPRRRKGS
ncbi:cupin domain-containing protein [Cupriavidus lacunae]|uniref:Cupin type-2 domain-containing protein n=1 Tax=Cupriavidus lacunae TaxID=2666307 RepID=A0A370NIB9_9BURK|nr:cupin domain-containing protein [Cupriavidus lacunae]RDK05308.1 hypothetical protein DN412_37720 [Cupriavidus lacunae]